MIGDTYYTHEQVKERFTPVQFYFVPSLFSRIIQKEQKTNLGNTHFFSWLISQRSVATYFKYITSLWFASKKNWHFFQLIMSDSAFPEKFFLKCCQIPFHWSIIKMLKTALIMLLFSNETRVEQAKMNKPTVYSDYILVQTCF